MPVWGYFVIGFVILALVLLTARRNQVAYRETAVDYTSDFRDVIDSAVPAVEEIRDALREGEPQALSRASAAARTRIHANISNLDRLGIPDGIDEEMQELLGSLRTMLRQAMECYEWGARISETTDLLENVGLRRAFDSLTAAGDQLCVEARFQLIGLQPVDSGDAPGD
ncbi:MAG: hypothetical protein M3010_05005 [Candidatus Dormibacteraeota bacterium]|nr:hypothetical protein [Candidatus Dormibacteraeota bacterium]